jgi:hypothetical protein
MLPFYFDTYGVVCSPQTKRPLDDVHLLRLVEQGFIYVSDAEFTTLVRDRQGLSYAEIDDLIRREFEQST